MTYQEALKYLDSLINYEKLSDFDYRNLLKLDRVRKFAGRFGNPEHGIKSVHISGTKGKGSVASFVNSILMEAGFNVGLYTSPHLVSFRERIRINGEPISEEDVARLLDRVRPYVESLEGNRDMRPTYFEICTIMAFMYFREQKADFMVLEVGMGGRLDATNITESPVSVITPISYDHVKYLGPDITDIAFEKCGIIKENSAVISSPQEEKAMGVIKRVCEERHCRLSVIGKDILFEKKAINTSGGRFNLITRYSEYPDLEIGLLGDFQVENAAQAVAAAEELTCRGIIIRGDAVRSGLKKARWPGRLELVSKKPYIILDGAQNRQSALRLKKAIKEIFTPLHQTIGLGVTGCTYKRLYLIIGIMKDKDIDGICRELCEIADCAIITKSRSERASGQDEIKEMLKKYKDGIDIVMTGSVGEAVDKARTLAGDDSLVLITGSLYVVAEAAGNLSKVAHP